MDKITLKRIDMLHPDFRDNAHQMYADMCKALIGRVIPRFAYTLRTIKEQNELYQKGRTTSGPKVTNAKGGQSYHNYGLAFDLVLLIDTDGNGTFETATWDTLKDFDGDKASDWNECVLIAKKYGWEWGGDWLKFKDQPHFQKTFGKSIAELLVATKFKQDNIEYPKL
jgi:peptidoglycan L-alanyl-D-glutamate endopeptidase CwlK